MAPVRIDAAHIVAIGRAERAPRTDQPPAAQRDLHHHAVRLKDDIADMHAVKAQQTRESSGDAHGPSTSDSLVRARAATGRLRRSLRPRLGVAISGVDGAGKSTLSQIVVDDLHRAGIPADRIWTRPGLRIGVLERVGIAVKHVLGEDPRPTVQRVAQGESPAMLRSRRGLAGWAWSFLVTCSFLIDVRRRQLAGRGILFYDRHVLDALATLRLAYGGVDTRLHEAVARRLLPNAFASFYLEVPADVARARKHDDVFGAYAIAHQLETYASALAVAGAGVHILDGLRPPRVLANDVLATLAEVAGAGVSRPRASARRSA